MPKRQEGISTPFFPLLLGSLLFFLPSIISSALGAVAGFPALWGRLPALLLYPLTLGVLSYFYHAMNGPPPRLGEFARFWRENRLLGKALAIGAVTIAPSAALSALLALTAALPFLAPLNLLGFLAVFYAILRLSFLPYLAAREPDLSLPTLLRTGWQSTSRAGGRIIILYLRTLWPLLLLFYLFFLGLIGAAAARGAALEQLAVFPTEALPFYLLPLLVYLPCFHLPLAGLAAQFLGKDLDPAQK